MGKKADGKPRSRSTSYMFFVRICREEHEKQHPGVKLDFKEFFRKCSERWKDMLPTEKELFEEMAQKDKIRYENEMANYVPPPGEIKRKRKQVKDPNAPKRCLSAFFIFCKDHRAKMIEEKPELKVSEVATLLGKMWKLSTPEVKKSYEERAAQDRKRYEKEMIIFRSQQVSVEPTKDIPVPKAIVEEFQPKAKVAKLKPEKLVKPQALMAVSVKHSQPQLPPSKPMIKNAKITDNRTKIAKAQMAAQAARAAAAETRVAAESDDQSEEEDDEEEGVRLEDEEEEESEEEEEVEEEGSSEAGEKGSGEEEEEEEEAEEEGEDNEDEQSKDNKNASDDNDDDDEVDDDDSDDENDDDDDNNDAIAGDNEDNGDDDDDDDEDDDDE